MITINFVFSLSFKVAFGLDLNTIHDKDAKFVGAVDLAFEGIQKHFRSPFWRVSKITVVSWPVIGKSKNRYQNEAKGTFNGRRYCMKTR